MLPLRRKLVKEKEGPWRRRIYRKYASCKWLKNAGLEFTRADVVVSISRGPPGQWFPETEYWASAIFVGTSGIPPKLIYRSVKSYKCHSLHIKFHSLKIRYIKNFILSYKIPLYCKFYFCNFFRYADCILFIAITPRLILRAVVSVTLHQWVK